MSLPIHDDEYQKIELYQDIVYKTRDVLRCGNIANVPDEVSKLHTRYNDALARIATLERIIKDNSL